MTHDRRIPAPNRLTTSVRFIWLAAIGLLGSGVAVYQLSPYIARHNAQEAASALYILYKAFVRYDDNHGYFPPSESVSSDGVPLVSWRYLVVPFLGSSPQFDFRPDEAWDAEVNKPWRDTINVVDYDERKDARTFGIVGKDTAFDSSRRYRLDELPGWLWIAVRVSESKQYWIKPGDLSIEDFHDVLAGHSGPLGITLGETFLVLPADGTVLQVSAKVPWDVVRRFLTTDGGSERSNARLAPYIAARATSGSSQLARP